ncbi:hypothetical protein [Streptococcus acidominimus]|uniref:Uncharacterized protein n=1 Tax=Streptococcus acidominimus TaxID=1326 RepID=A0A4Y9FJL1_STRAI|nr:hypothetical protein [Streptococcus acidominimus]MBF0819862.1 hypothetical protein [Streptococcus acidominimus]MBF0839417.1 hypothetical protein [Streptococcus acidominimus]MBF0847167.1 hypothetical protein [Streptococcus danieliae]TFU29226.1 hypothetical protein E4U01_10435 [Streptococcus acidominimus]
METKRNKDNEQKVAQRIAEEFSKTYVDPDGNKIESITFYQKPKYSNDFTDNITYMFYINNNKEWIVGASVKESSEEIWAYGSDYIELIESQDRIVSKTLKVNYWEDDE